ncbi:LOW QUALITY PROTEIN: peptidyl-prolyl cis-trans isomerase FKBP14-like [Lethenteron reissneri]|uniref:LOW QUALITY PROTEIN: peptidyl-prolyl cis-trans isomerase FKBP14-like n=1 Tax=Lethenteron reissneri TaxID=7753 RepID=UPI002AB7E8A6|nr:LOW QUALITY PROTEIN: peptidyl-prolyl cis-trans isomerase FKBP14-like [Lethenteron reissneri]
MNPARSPPPLLLLPLLLLPLLLPLLLLLLEPRPTAAAKIPEAEVKVEVTHRPFLCHRKSKRGDLVALSYRGFLENGTRFHSTDEHNNGHPVWVTLGVGEVIRGWDRGLVGMCVGEKRRLTVPPTLAYGKEGKGEGPPDATLIFDMELHEIRNGPRSHESFQEMDLDDDWKLSRIEVEEYLRKEFSKSGVNHNESYQGLVEDIFTKEDEDEDGFISAREFTYRHDEL